MMVKMAFEVVFDVAIDVVDVMGIVVDIVVDVVKCYVPTKASSGIGSRGLSLWYRERSTLVHWTCS